MRNSKPHNPIATFALACLCALAGLVGCDTASDPKNDSGTRISPVTVHLQPAAHLDAPLVGTERAYQPTCQFNIQSSNRDEILGIALFDIDASTTDFDRLKIRLASSTAKLPAQLIRLNATSPIANEAACPGEPLSAEALGFLSDGHGVFWIDSNSPSPETLKQRITVAIPSTMLTESVYLESYVDETSTGDPRGGDQLELVQDFFYLTVIGDSVMWGNGLLDGDKISTLVANSIESATGRKVIRTVYAMSGATLIRTPFDEVCTFRCSGEVPTAFRSINLQIDTIEHPDQSDLILMDGCINDVTLERILSTESTPEEIEYTTAYFCNDEMVATLDRLKDIAPQTPIIVTGYFPFVSSQSDFSGLLNWAQAQGFDVDNVNELGQIADTFAHHAEVFYDASTVALESAIANAVTRRENATDITLVDPGFGPEHAVFTEDSWVWDLRLDRELARRLGLDIGLVPEDPMLMFRVEACFEDGSISDPFTCLFASVGHPNVKGAKAYAEAIIKALKETNQLPQ
ncbi:MAG: SGNH/GDSL hydrolase family protein [Phycisphaerales bacterium]|nr:SGNH/GDSL hydrolase family protein [Phycisphaerales bacterium]